VFAPAKADLTTPLLRGHEVIGSLNVSRDRAHPYSERQIELIETFADQAVIAIENARLFEELEQRNGALADALDQQTATAEILGVIANSPTDLQPVLDAIAENAARVCGANDAAHGPIPKRRVGEQALNLVRGSIPGRAMLDRRTVHVHDIQSEDGAEFPFSRALQGPLGTRTNLATPLLRAGTAIGGISIRRMEVQPFTRKQIKMLETFADQAVIAIETPGCSRNWSGATPNSRRATVRSPRRWSSRPPPPRSCALSPLPRRTFSPCSTPSRQAPCA
jgi:two-component system, NtrC family, sensor kinase